MGRASATGHEADATGSAPRGRSAGRHPRDRRGRHRRPGPRPHHRVRQPGRRPLLRPAGNIFLGDDGFGVAVATRLAAAGPPPDGVTVAEYGIRGVHLAYELLDGYDVLVLVDALPMGEAPGTLAVIEAEPVPSPADPAAAPVVDAHSMSPAAVLTALAGLGGALQRVLVVGCQPATVEEGIGLSPPVAAAVEPAVALCTEVMAGVQAGTVEAVGEESPR